MVYIHETVKLGVKIEKNGHLCFLPLKIDFGDLKLKLPLQPLIITEKLETALRSKILSQMRTL